MPWHLAMTKDRWWHLASEPQNLTVKSLVTMGRSLGYRGLGNHCRRQAANAMTSAQPTLPRLASLLLLAPLCCGGNPSRKSVGEHRTAVVGGVVDAGHPSVGMLLRKTPDGTYLCTASLVGNRSVLTAGHCIGDGEYRFVLGEHRYRVAETFVHPDYWSPPIFEILTRNDIAVVRLTEAPAVRPHPISENPPALGDSVRLVGYGSTGVFSSEDVGTKRTAENIVLWKTFITIGFFATLGDTGQICHGDSGGPTFALARGREVQVGVHSKMWGFCQVVGFDARVDRYVSWIKQVSDGDVFVDGSLPPTPREEPQARPVKPLPTPSTDAPSVQILLPHDGAVIADSTPLAIEAAISAQETIARVELLINGKRHRSSPMLPPYRFSVSLAPGPAEIEVRAIDSGGRIGHSRAGIVISHVGPPAGETESSPSPAPSAGSGGCALGIHNTPLPATVTIWLLVAARRRQRSCACKRWANGGKPVAVGFDPQTVPLAAQHQERRPCVLPAMRSDSLRSILGLLAWRRAPRHGPTTVGHLLVSGFCSDRRRGRRLARAQRVAASKSVLLAKNRYFPSSAIVLACGRAPLSRGTSSRPCSVTLASTIPGGSSGIRTASNFSRTRIACVIGPLSGVSLGVDSPRRRVQRCTPASNSNISRRSSLSTYPSIDSERLAASSLSATKTSLAAPIASAPKTGAMPTPCFPLDSLTSMDWKPSCRASAARRPASAIPMVTASKVVLGSATCERKRSPSLAAVCSFFARAALASDAGIVWAGSLSGFISRDPPGGLTAVVSSERDCDSSASPSGAGVDTGVAP